MQYLKIKNKGLLDKRLLSLMGGTTKRDDKFKIGKFGTGMKYALAFLLRNNIDFKIFIGGEEVKISCENEHIRDTEFNVVYIDGEKTSLTTMMGDDWKAWMIIREIWCNALDEEDSSYEVTTQIDPQQDTTEFYIQNTGDIASVVKHWDEFFIHELTPIMDARKFAVYKSTGKGLRLYKNGVLIYVDKTDDCKNGVFSYDIKDARLNELRQFRGSVVGSVKECILRFDKDTAISFMENVKGREEEGIDFFSYDTFSAHWKDAMGSAQIIGEEVKEKMLAKGALDASQVSEMIVLPNGLFKGLNQQWKGVSAVIAARNMSEFFVVDDPKVDRQLAKARAILESCNYQIDPDLKFIVGAFGTSTKIAEINIETKSVHVSDTVATRSLFQVCAMLVEENEHYKTGLGDCSREFQQHWIDMVMSLMFEANKVQL